MVKYLVLTIFLYGCASNPQSLWQVKTGERNHLAFSGKGAAAGIMIDTYSGGMGAAIGVAIDEGIAKNIAENVQRYPSGFDIASMVSAQLRSHYARKPSPFRTAAPLQVIIETYGFHTIAGEGDKVTAWLKLRFISSGKEYLINFPSGFAQPKQAELADIKTNPDLAYQLLDQSIARVIEQWEKDNS